MQIRLFCHMHKCTWRWQATAGALRKTVWRLFANLGALAYLAGQMYARCKQLPNKVSNKQARAVRMFAYRWAMPNMTYPEQVKHWCLYKGNYRPNEAVWRMQAVYR